MATKPHNIIYGVNDKLSPVPLFFYGLQMTSCSAGSLVMPVVIARAALLGSMGQNISSSSVGVPVQTGVTCRSIS